MAGEPQVSGLVDPLQAFTGISLFPRTIRASPDAPLPSDPNDLESLHNFMKSMVPSSPERALEEAKTILDKGTELVNSKFGQFLESLGIDKDAVALEGKENPQQRREGLGRKRARFSLKPATSQPSKNLEPSIDIDRLQDPAEFFSAYEKLENARREIQIQKGETSPHSTNYELSRNRRRRRLGILGKSASYKHQYSSAIPGDEDMHMSSQELLADVLPSQDHDKLRSGTNSPYSENEKLDVEGSLIETENKVDNILHELLSKDNADLDGDGALYILQERLQIKPIDLGDLSIPHFHDIGRTNFKAMAEKLPRARKSLSNFGSLAKKLSKVTPEKLKQGVTSPLNLIGSPTPPRSPFASMSLLKKRSQQSNTHRDPFSPFNVDVSEPRNSYSGADIDKESHQVSGNKPNMSSNLRLNMEDDACGRQVSDIDVRRVEHVGLVVSPLDKDIQQQVTDTNTSPHKSQIDMTEQRIHMNLYGTTNVSDLSGGQEDTQRDFSPMLTDNVGDGLIVSPPAGETLLNNEDKAKYSSSLDGYQSNCVEGNLEEMHSKEASPAHQVAKVQESVNMDTLKENGPLINEVTVTQVATEDSHVDMSSTVEEISAEQDLQTQQHCKTKKPQVGRRESKAHPLRPSLAAAGTYFESGVRRSKRIKTRPLEYWKGERLVFGRVNDSIKLIGMKYISPAKGGGKLKVKSYVPDEYKEILDMAAEH